MSETEKKTKLIKGPGVLLATSLSRYSTMNRRECLNIANAASELVAGFQRKGSARPAMDSLKAAAPGLSEEQIVNTLLDFGVAIHARAQQLAMEGRAALLDDPQCQVWMCSGLEIPKLPDNKRIS